MNSVGPSYPDDGGRYTHTFETICTPWMPIPTSGIWLGDDIMRYSVPLFIMQVLLTVVIIRIFMFILKPLRQPPYVSQILCGLLLGPTGLGSIQGKYKTSMFGISRWETGPVFAIHMFPDSGITALETMAYVGVFYYAFLVGLEIDLRIFKRTGRRALTLALFSILVPFVIAYGTTSTLGNITSRTHINKQSKEEKDKHLLGQTLFLGISLAITSFPVVAGILTENKLINTDTGRLAMSSTIIVDVIIWMLLAVAIPIGDITYFYIDPDRKKPDKAIPLYTFLCCLAYVAFAFFVIRPIIIKLVKRKPEGERFTSAHIGGALIAVLACSFFTDLIGAHGVFGALVLGLVTPYGSLSTTLTESLEDFVSGLMVPLFYVVSGLRTNLHTLYHHVDDYKLLIFIVIGIFGAKLVTVFLISTLNKMQPTDSISLGLLLNTKGLMQLIILNSARDLEVLDQKSFAIMVLASLIMTSIISPLVNFIYKSAKRFTRNKYKTFEMLWKSSTELRIVTCLHGPRQASGIINLLEISNPSKETPISVYVLSLVELTGRASAMLIVSNAGKSNRTQAQSEQINAAFRNYEQKHYSVYTETITAISPYDTMHEDICNLAEEKRSTLIILPFHKQQAVDGAMEVINPAHRNINQNVLVNAPCTVGILVDRGLGGSLSNGEPQYVALLFFGGPDDREALSFAQRLARNQNIRLNVLRFLSVDNIEEPTREDEATKQPLTLFTEKEKERQIDDDFLRRFRTRSEAIDSITYNEIVITNVEEMIDAIRSAESNNGLFIVGRAQSIGSSLTVALAEWSECPELGVVGELLAAEDFKTTMSVLIMKQYMGATAATTVAAAQTGSGLNTPYSQHSDKHFNHFSNSSSQALR